MRRIPACTAAVAVAAFVASGSVVPSDARACDNDSDAVSMERLRFPDVQQALAGTYVRHSPEWFEWRAKDRLTRIAMLASPDGAVRESSDVRKRHLAALDDLGVAYDKLGRHAEAIAAGREALGLAPDRYESLADLGTALVHAGDTAEGLVLLRRAMAVNPDAHFGREKYEIAFYEYVTSRREATGVALPLYEPKLRVSGALGFAAFLAAKRTPAGVSVAPLSGDERAAAAKAVVGLLFSTRFDDPALLEVLAHLLVDPDQPWRSDESTQELAARAYLGASWSAESPVVQAAYHRLAADAITDADGVRPARTRAPLEEIESTFRDERSTGDDLRERIARDEAQFLRDTHDPERAFAAKYLDATTEKISLASASVTRPPISPSELSVSVVEGTRPTRVPVGGVPSTLVLLLSIGGLLVGARLVPQLAKAVRPRPRMPVRRLSARR